MKLLEVVRTEQSNSDVVQVDFNDHGGGGDDYSDDDDGDNSGGDDEYGHKVVGDGQA